MKHFAYLILTLLLVFSGCTSTEASKDKNYIPTEPGIKWFRDMQEWFEKENNEYKSYWNDFLLMMHCWWLLNRQRRSLLLSYLDCIRLVQLGLWIQIMLLCRSISIF